MSTLQCSHKIETLDKTFMDPLKSHYSEKVSSFLRHWSRLLSIFHIMEPFGRTYLKVQFGDITVNGIIKYYSINRNICSSVDFIVSTLAVPTLVT